MERPAAREVVIRRMGAASDLTSAIKPIEKAAGMVVGGGTGAHAAKQRHVPWALRKAISASTRVFDAPLARLRASSTRYGGVVRC